jgi:hypothetical protein
VGSESARQSLFHRFYLPTKITSRARFLLTWGGTVIKLAEDWSHNERN